MELQSTSFDIWDAKYHLKKKDGTPIDITVDGTLRRVANALAAVEKPENQADCESNFYVALQLGAVPAGRITSNAGAQAHKPETSTINCTVSGTIEDSMDGILGMVHEAGLTLKAGCGIGYEFSTLRPKGAYVAGAGATTSGPLSFMDIYDKTCFTVSSAGGRRGAQMATFDIGHPDVLDFIKAKREAGRLRQFNLSCLITKEFIDAVNSDADWKLAFPVKQKEIDEENPEIVWREWPVTERYVTREDGKVACRVYKTLKAKRLWDVIMSSTYDFAEPGFIMIDEVNEMNNLWFCENIRATNPCGEQPLPPYGSCLLGSINLAKFVLDPFTESARFDWQSFEHTVRVFTRMLDNVVEINGLALDKQRQELEFKRRHGMGFFGLGSALAMLRMSYGSKPAVDFTSSVAETMAHQGWMAGVALAKEKGAAPVMDQLYEVTTAMLAQRPELATHGIKVGSKVHGRKLLAYGSRYMKKLGEKYPDLIKDIAKYGCRFSHHTSIAPTGTIALSLGNNASNGIEPSFAHQYSRNVIVPGKKTKEKVEVMSYEFMLYKQLVDKDATLETLPDYFVNADSISPKAHVDMQAAAQKWVDSAISKTINVPTDIPYDDFKGIYLYAAEQGLKGCTTFRFNPEAFQGVLVNDKDLENTTYKFTLEDGSVIEAKGNDEIEYDGELHTAANLYDALRDGVYGKF